MKKNFKAIYFSFTATLVWQLALLPLYLFDLIYFNPILTLSDFAFNFLFILSLVIFFGNRVFAIFLIAALYFAGIALYFFTKKNLTISQIQNIPELYLNFPYEFLIILFFVTFLSFSIFFVAKKRTRHLSISNKTRFFYVLFLIIFFLSATLKPEFFWKVIEGHNINKLNRFATWKSGGQIYSIFFHFIESQILRKKLKDHKTNLSNKFIFKHEINDLNIQKNVYIILLESYVSKSKLNGLNLNFLEKINFKMHELQSPVFGGNSAASEFEILCGIPETQILGDLTFNYLGRNETKICMPNWFKRGGYKTFSFTGTLPYFHNAENAYLSMGITERFHKHHLPEGDYDGVHPSDKTIYEFVYEKIKDSYPGFYYIFTAAGHSNYELNQKNRPRLTKNKYIDRITYTELEVKSFLEKIISKDPESLIVLLGDHATRASIELNQDIESRILPVYFYGFDEKIYRISHYFEIFKLIRSTLLNKEVIDIKTKKINRLSKFRHRNEANDAIMSTVKLSLENDD